MQHDILGLFSHSAVYTETIWIDYLIRRILPDLRGVQAWWSHGWAYPRYATKKDILARGNSTRVEDEESTRSNMKQTH